jgi:hypothetical protein
LKENDFDGWPDTDELPLKYLTQEHKDALIAKCSKYNDCTMPIFENSPVKGATASLAVSANTITPLPISGTLENKQEHSIFDANAITPIHTEIKAETSNVAPKKSIAGMKPSKAQLEIHRKWQAAAEAEGGPNARIVLHKPVAKKIIFDFLFDTFRPMNITEIHKVSFRFTFIILTRFMKSLKHHHFTTVSFFCYRD